MQLHDASLPDATGLIESVAAKRSKGNLGVRVIATFPKTGEEIANLQAGVYDEIFAACEQQQVPLFFMISQYLPLAELSAEDKQWILGGTGGRTGRQCPSRSAGCGSATAPGPRAGPGRARTICARRRRTGCRPAGSRWAW